MFTDDPLKRSKIETFEDGFSVSTPDGVDRVMLSSVKGASAYKRDQFITDLICCDIETYSTKGVLVRTIHEEMTGFHEAMSKLEELPGFYRYWREAVILPAFVQNYTELYRDGHDFSELGAENPPGRESESNTSAGMVEDRRISKKKLLVILAAIILFVAMFHIVMNWLAVDRCLDGGGRWHEQARKCEGSGF